MTTEGLTHRIQSGKTSAWGPTGPTDTEDPTWKTGGRDPLCISECAVLRARVKFITRGLEHLSAKGLVSLCLCLHLQKSILCGAALVAPW